MGFETTTASAALGNPVTQRDAVRRSRAATAHSSTSVCRRCEEGAHGGSQRWEGRRARRQRLNAAATVDEGVWGGRAANALLATGGAGTRAGAGSTAEGVQDAVVAGCWVLGAGCCVLRVGGCVLRAACCVLCAACCVSGAAGALGVVEAASVSQAAARSSRASEQHWAHYRSMHSRGAAQRQATVGACGAEGWREKT
ncbi:uncharacterized protein M421DRAFT_113448 [Didymella exigua CBS 183.55]|uniref:Uncharacterized protein n=1 Tax=Didymella exigua CBS 183.55 TaxID=1150837 RepID=A0A6A5S081_9PLEO|nr:uncharacterized protein M421DRAFT_113448 [Didymella exigua CBS 183.55]KAF1934125.1 hypothetical protein M421DRAFT_113448 [Didymella exigua CBS 183.55]